ncbi:hypothetical protein V9T40_000945 [Parthenolecanium corni]|uniref:EMI domain-containing protein n=1 Tax=Parthenolecanium corni TaxID=536013 RepID=A0AAN9Y0W4_9HEMI
MLIERGDSSKRMIPLFILLVCSGFGNVQCDTDVYGKLFGQGVCSIHREDTKRVLTYQRNVHPEMEYTLCWNFPPRCETPTGKELEEFITVPQDIKHEILSLKCCANYYPSKDDSFCIPICSQLCLPSKCLSPNNCSECQAGHYGPACTNAKDTLSNLPPVPYECECPNENYMCTNDLKCVCVAGFGGSSCFSPSY